MAKLDLPVKTNEEALAAWDANLPVWSCSMGGMSDGYEQAIHIVAFEMLRSMLQHPCPEPLPVIPIDQDRRTINEVIAEQNAHRQKWQEYLDMIEKTPNVVAAIEQCQITGAQFGAAVNLAGVFIMNGYQKAMLEQVPDGREIMVSKTFPTLVGE